MSIRSTNKINVEGGGMSSMTDLVFLLLIFFIILSTLAKSSVDVDLPQGGTNDAQQVKAVDVVIYPDNSIMVGRIKTTLADAALVIMDQITEDKVVEIYADEKSNSGTLVELIAIAKANELKVSLMADK